MRAYLPDYSVFTPETLDEAVEALDSDEEVWPLAGGTDLMVYMESGDWNPCTFLNLYGLKDIEREPRLNGGLTLSPLSTYSHTRKIENVKSSYPMLATAAREISVLALQSRATWIGNIVNASPAADGVPALMAYDARVELQSMTKGTREVPLSKFYSGYKQMDRENHELVTAVHLPAPENDWCEYYNKIGTRRFQAITKTLLAGRIKMEGNTVEDVRLCFASVAPYTLRATETEDLIRGEELTPELIEEASEAIQEEIQPIDDIRSNETYRRKVTSNLVRDFLSTD